ncbi:MAG: hypothetical protein M1818_000487 [Claussenomyces sp. TS43310]|nr:MAG: hypothetical protein M1818_000487 [Claussenomyces sp. TS43310]
MAFAGSPEDFFTYEGRLASFQTASKRRASHAKGKAAKTIKWPHRFLSAEELASAGFFYQPSSEGNDNVTCFLCRKSILGWEKEDVPLIEHLKLSPNCGWAIVASIEANDENLLNEYPASERMIEARRATFADKWPHEHKKGWKCKTKQLVDAGWIYKPTPEYDDMAMCSYCNLGLDGWEPKDEPMEQHYKRNPDCTFFTLINNHQEQPMAKKAKGRKPRASRSSKNSRLSIQSVLTIDSDAPSLGDTAAEEDDSILTTATNATVTSQAGRKMPRKKPTGRKTRTKKSEAVDGATLEPEDDDFEVKVDNLSQTTRGKKRASEAMDGASGLTTSQMPDTKRRATRTRGSIACDSVTDVFNDLSSDITKESSGDLIEGKSKVDRQRGRTSKAKKSRSASTASKASLRLHLPDDDELEHAILAELDQPFADVQDVAGDILDAKASERCESTLSGKPSAASIAPVRKTRASKVIRADHAMFGTQEMEVDDAALEAELEKMQTQQSQPLPKAKGTKVRQARKPSAKQQAAAKRAAESAHAKETRLRAESQPEEEQGLGTADSNKPADRPSPPQPPKGRKAGDKPPPQKAKGRRLAASDTSVDESSVSSNPGVHSEQVNATDDLRGNDSEASMDSESTIIRRGSVIEKPKRGKKVTSRKNAKTTQIPSQERTDQDPQIQEPTSTRSAKTKQMPELQNNAMRSVGARQLVASTPFTELPSIEATMHAEAIDEPTQDDQQEIRHEQSLDDRLSASELREDTPSLSPQSSDAENQPPSSKPSIAKPASSVSRIALAISTPNVSPSKRNVIAGLQTSLPWSAIDLDRILLQSPGANRENADHATNLLEDAVNNAKKGELTSPEKRMTVDQWIHFNAGLAEERLKGECERMISIFEREGGRAMRVLEEVRCLE